MSRNYPLFNEYYYQWQSPFVKTFHTHPQYEIYYFHQGKCDYLIGDQVYTLEPGDAIIMNGMTRHGPIVQRDAEYVRSMYSFYPEMVRVFHPMLGPLNPLRPFETLKNWRIRLRGEQKEEVEDILRRINKYYYCQQAIEFNRFLVAFFDLLWIFYDECRSDMERSTEGSGAYESEKERNVQTIISLIEERYSERITLDMLEKSVFMSKHHLSRIFRELTGMSIIDYLYKYRINQAKIRFICNRNSAVNEVYREVGFQSMAHFSRLFKKFVGLSPEQFRRKVQPFLLNPLELRLPVFPETVPPQKRK
ncbi:helix-turn-helix domain-containing protein [Paenibacillus mesophilus]|uniref:AraC family transcriptional regulator n=1 Tax=Paenibacillus mesophilus TaxID=2582849 RepID=UPI00110E1BD9|nr:AraC family transcriptional regulator [Paenibacillus mesophilus]TMV47206.1 helix-turn-helix domain-containing protein [Paenibacillus mesophilus]